MTSAPALCIAGRNPAGFAPRALFRTPASARQDLVECAVPAYGDLAAAAAYKPPSIWGQALSGTGGLLASYAGANASPNGAQLPFDAGSMFAPTPSSMLGPYTARPSDF